MSDVGGTPSLPAPNPSPDPAEPGSAASAAGASDFHWQGFFQRAREPLFLLNRRRRILFVNRAWEQLTGVTAMQARGLACTRSRPAESGAWEEVLAHALYPPPEVLQGQFSRGRRLIPGAPATERWWDLEFLPLCDEHGLLGIVGRVTLVHAERASQSPPLPERLVELREGVAQRYGIDQLASTLPAMRRVANQTRLAAQTGTPVLLRGERGTGKHWLARCIHHRGITRERTFVALDCARLPATALAAVLLGDKGLLQRGDVGTLYLRDPAALPRELQARLGELLQIERRCDGLPPLRVLAGCTADPMDLVRAGLLLEELRCALSTLVIELPRLCDRRADLRCLVDRLLERINADAERRVRGLSPAAWELLQAYGWPGNLAELHTVLLNAAARARGERIEAEELPAYLRTEVRLERTDGAAAERALPLDQLLEQAERRLIQVALRRAQGNKSRAAEILSIWRPRLLRRMEALGIEGPTPENDAGMEPG